MAILEAMATGRAIVAGDAPGCRSVVEDGVNGILVPPGAPAALSRRILDLLASAQLRRRMGEKGRAIAEREFGVAQMRASYDALYEDLTGLKLPRIAHGAA